MSSTEQQHTPVATSAISSLARPSILAVAIVLLLSSATVHAQTCPSAVTHETSPSITLTTNTSDDYTFATPLAPCESVYVIINCSSCSGSPNMSLEFYASDNTWLDGSYFICGSSCPNGVIPTPSGEYVIAAGYPYPAMVGGAGYTPAYVEVHLGYGVASETFTLDVTRTPRPGYNLGGTTFSNAPTISVGAIQYGSLDGYGQYYKVHIGSGDTTFVTARVVATTGYSPVLYFDLYDPSHNYIGAYYATTTSGKVYFPPLGGSPSGHYWTNYGAAGDFFVKLTAYYGIVTDFQFALQTTTASSFTLSATNVETSTTGTKLYQSTGDTTNFITSTPVPSTAFLNPGFNISLTSDLNSDCTTSLSVADAIGNGPVDSTVQANYLGASTCTNASGLFSVNATAMGTSSGTSVTVVVPPQVMIRAMEGEMRNQSGDDSRAAVLEVARKRLGDSGFAGGATHWQGQLLFNGAFKGVPNSAVYYGPAAYINLAGQAYDGTSTVTICSGCKSYWSPTNSDFWTLTGWSGRQAGSVSNSDWQSIHAPYDTWLGQARQAVVWSTIANSVIPGNTSAPAMVFFRLANSSTDPAVVWLP